MSGISNFVRSHLADLRQQCQESPLLRMALWGAASLAVLHLVLIGWDWRAECAARYQGLAREWLKLQEISRQKDWPARALQAEDGLRQLRDRFWQYSDASRARAEVQAWLDEQVRSSGVPDATISVLAPSGFETDAVARIEAQVRGVFEPGSFSRFLHSVESEPRKISVDYLELNNDVSPAINLQLSFLFSTQPQATR
ncbi:hypothetical protein D9M68_588700 [compost metagenome]